MTGKRIAVGIAAAAVVLVAVVALAAHQRGARVDTAALTPPSTTGTVTSVVKGMDDQLAPLPDGATPALTTDQVIALLKKNPGDAAYASDPNLTVISGSYTNANLHDEKGSGYTGVMVYVIRGTAPCSPSNGASATAPTVTDTPKATTCTGTIIADANTGSPLLLSEDQNP